MSSGPVDFNKCIDYEKSQQARADKFYYSRGATNVIRWDWNDKEHGRYMQKDDIDVSIELYNARNILDTNKKTIDISEKFRSIDFGDHMIEIWSDYEHRKPGSHLVCEADWIEQFVPGGVYEVQDAPALRELATYIIVYFDWNKMFEELPIGTPSKLVKFNYKGQEYNIRLYKGVSAVGSDKTWHNLCAIISWSDLNNMGIRSKYYQVS